MFRLSIKAGHRLWASSLICLPIAFPVWGQGTSVTLEDLLSIERLGLPTLSPDGKQIVFSRDGQLYTMPAAGGWPVVLTTNVGGKSSPAWSPDGTRICYTARSPEYFSGKLRVVRFDPRSGRIEGDPVDLHAAPADRRGGWSIPRASWTADGKRLAVVLQHSGWDKIYLITVNGGEPRALTSGESEDSDPVISPDGTQVAFVSNRANLEEKHIWLAPLDGSAPRRLTRFGTGVESDPQWSPDGRKIYFTRTTPLESPNLAVADTTGEGQVRTLTSTLPKNF